MADCRPFAKRSFSSWAPRVLERGKENALLDTRSDVAGSRRKEACCGRAAAALAAVLSAVLAVLLSPSAAHAASDDVDDVVIVTATCCYDNAAEQLELTSELREEAGVDPLAMDADLQEAAMQRADGLSLFLSTSGLTARAASR